MKKISELKYSFPDAENYRRREFKEVFNKNFVADDYVQKILEPQISFLIGEKGAGKTAYAVYLSNNNIENNVCDLKFIRETEYQAFVSLKNEKHLLLSDYTNIWTVILLLLLSKQIAEKESGILAKFTKFKNLNLAIDRYYANAFSPEIISAMELVKESKMAAEIFNSFSSLGTESKDSVNFKESRFQTNLLYLQRQFKEALSSLKLAQSHTLFIDGIDIRPGEIEYKDYLDCVKGLANAVWQLNNDFFPSIRDSKGRLKIILLVRPDIFSSLGMQNQNTKIKSNSVYLDWRTTYENYAASSLFRMVDKILVNQQDSHIKNSLSTIGMGWNHYFPYGLARRDYPDESDSSFIGFLRYSFYRPRDILMMLDILRENVIEKNEVEKTQHELSDFESPSFKRKLAEHLLGEIKDQISFYYDANDYELFLKFFELLNGATKFTYDEYLSVHSSLVSHIASTSQTVPNFMDSANKFLQFLYEINVICYVEDVIGHKPMIHWSFRDRSFSNFSPKVKEGVRYEIFYGLTRAVNTGKRRI